MSITHSANVGTVSDCRYILNHSSLAIIQLGGENMSDHESKVTMENTKKTKGQGICWATHHIPTTTFWQY